MLYADEHGSALPLSVESRVPFAGPRDAWRLPAGWIRLYNEAQAVIARVMPDVVITRVQNKGGGLKIHTDPYLSAEASEALRIIRAKSFHTCDLCGEPGRRQEGRWITRCDSHPVNRDRRVWGALARPPE